MTKKNRKPTDEEILAAIREWGNRSMTYVVRNRLVMHDKFQIKTPWVLRQLKRLERSGRVERVSSPYATQFCWSAPHPEPAQEEGE